MVTFILPLGNQMVTLRNLKWEEQQSGSLAFSKPTDFAG